MTTVQNSASIASLQAAMNGTSSTTSATTDSVSETEDRFMKLLVAQMKNQDPLNPLDNAQVTSQLAQLSTVSGINKLNATLEAFQASQQVNQTYQAANMIGHGVFVAGSGVTLASSQAILGADLASGSDAVKVTILDSVGKTVHTMNLGAQKAGILSLAWDGKTDSGTTAADGQYSFTVAATSAGQKIDATALAFGQVASVTTGTSGVKLNVPSIGAVGMTDIHQIF
jgi:flagellar basal-body rod modification protein FlgD